MFNQEQIRQLVTKYPYLQPCNVWTGKVDADYEFDCFVGEWLPAGWTRLFLMLVKELKPYLVRANVEEKFYFLDVKEKYGTLRVYTSCLPDSVGQLLNLYESFSKYVCASCGEFATKVTTGWISHLCDHCVKGHEAYPIKQHKCMTIELWLHNEPHVIKVSYKTIKKNYKLIKTLSEQEFFDYLMED